MRTPCKDCDRRLVGCHTICREYQDWVKQREESKAANRKESPELCRKVRKQIWKGMLRR